MEDPNVNTALVGQIECGSERGSAFFLMPDLAITCRHCILPNLLNETPIHIRVGDATILAEVLDLNIPDAHDTVFLRLNETVEEGWISPLTAAHLPRNIPWETFGFPGTRGGQGMLLEGHVARSIDSEAVPYDLELVCDGDDLPSDYRGFSGAPVIVDGSVSAMIQKRLDGGLGAISLARLHSYLDAAGVKFRSSKNNGQLPPTLIRELDSTIPNSRTHREIEESLIEKPDKYLILEGYPGSGKTLVAASFTPTNKQLHVVGRYFAGGYVGAALPSGYYNQLAAFSQWLSNEAMLRSNKAVAAHSNLSVTKLSRSLVDNFAAIAETFTDDQLGILLIDGVEGNTPNSFFDFLPALLPKGLAVVITTTNSNLLKTSREDLCDSTVLNIHPLPLGDCEWLVAKKLNGLLVPSQVAHVAELSQGHPLTLSYFINEILAANEFGAENPVADLDLLAGDSSNYYQKIWNRISDDLSKYLLAVLARLRSEITEKELLSILPDHQKPQFVMAISNIRYLLRKNEDVIRFYHESFREFILLVTEPMDDQIHSTLASYCESTEDSEYAVTNLLYHRLKSSAIKQSASQYCTQEWVDLAAYFCVHPELVLSDVNEILFDRLKDGDLKEIIRLLLLRSRVRFRYDNAYALYATDLAKTMVALCYPAQALRFMFRDGFCLCTIDDAVTILRLLVRDGYYDEIMELYREMRRRFWLAHENGNANLDLLKHHVLATLAVISSGAISNPFPLANEIQYLSQTLEDYFEENNVPELDQSMVRASIHAAMDGQSLWRTGFASSHRKDAALAQAYSLLIARDITKECGYLPPLPTRPEIPGGVGSISREEIGEILKDSTIPPELPSGAKLTIANALLMYSDGFDRVRNLFLENFPLEFQANLRQENGVDADLFGLENVRFAHEVQEFTLDDSITKRINYSTRHGWEQLFFNAFSWLGQASGERYRYRILGEELEISLIELLRSEFWPQVSFSLSERSGWKDSYQIPESIVPQLMQNAAEMIAEFEPESSKEFSELILDHTENQFGLYTEGYQRMMASVANALAVIPQGVQPAADLRRALLKHISTRVFARQERIEGLLDCAQHLGRLNALEDADEAFQNAIDSSLGPNWYKEDQFSLMLDVIKAVDDPEFLVSQWKKTIETLALASGEATFQRFVRYEKEKLIRYLSCNGFFEEAFTTYSHYLLPDYQLQESRIKRINIDKASPLEGNCFGVLEVDEQGATLELLKGLGYASELRRWAVVELFWPWGDCRYYSGYAQEACQLLNSDKSSLIGDRLLRLLRAEVSPDRRQQFVSEITQTDEDGILTPWLEKAKELNIIDKMPSMESSLPDHSHGIEITSIPQSEARKKTDEIIMPGVLGRRESLDDSDNLIEQAKERIKRGDMESARALLCQSLKEMQCGEWSIFSSDLEQANTALNLLLVQCGSIEKGLHSLKECIMEGKHESEWRIAKKLMAITMPHLPAKDRHDLFSIITEHIECLVKPERQFISVQDEVNALSVSSEQISANDCIDKLLLSLLDHPNMHMRERAAETLEWLARESEIDLQLLIGRIASEKIGDGREIALGILHRLVLDDPQHIDTITSSASFELLCKDRSFLVRYFVEEILGKPWLAEEPTKPAVETPLLPSDFSWGIDIKLFLNLKEDSQVTAERWISELSTPFSVGEIRKLKDIRRHAFFAPYLSSGDAIERESIFRTYVDISDESIKNVLISASQWNPRWPNRNLSLDCSPMIPQILKKIESDELESAFVVGNQTILHCLEMNPPKQEQDTVMSEVISVLVCKECFEGKLNRDNLWESLSVHCNSCPEPLKESILATLQEPAIGRFEPEFRIGGNITPAFPSQRMIQLTEKKGFERVCWRDGRLWEPCGAGPPLQYGTALLIKSSQLQRIQNYDLIWVIFKDSEVTHIVDPKRKKVDEYHGN